MVVSFRLPKISMGAVSNLVGLVGLVAVAVALGGLLGNWWWTALSGGVFAVGLAVLAGLGAEAESQPQLQPASRAS